MPASPLTSTTCPSPSLLCSQRRSKRPISSSRPTRKGGLAGAGSASSSAELCRAEDTVDGHGLGDALELLHSDILQGERVVEQRRCRGTQHHRVGGRQALEARRNIRGIAQGELFLTAATADAANDYDAGVQAQTDRHAYSILQHQAGIQRLHGLHNGQPGVHCPLSSIFVRLRIAEVHQQTIAQVLRHVAVKGCIAATAAA